MVPERSETYGTDRSRLTGWKFLKKRVSKIFDKAFYIFLKKIFVVKRIEVQDS